MKTKIVASWFFRYFNIWMWCRFFNGKQDKNTRNQIFAVQYTTFYDIFIKLIFESKLHNNMCALGHFSVFVS